MPLIIDEWHQCSQDFEFHIASSGGKLAAGKKRNGGISESPEEYEEESKCSKLPSFTVHPFVTRYKTKPQVQHTPPTSTSLWTKYIKKPGTGAKGGAYCTAEISCACCTMEPSTNRTDFCAFEKIWRLRYKNVFDIWVTLPTCDQSPSYQECEILGLLRPLRHTSAKQNSTFLWWVQLQVCKSVCAPHLFL